MHDLIFKPITILLITIISIGIIFSLWQNTKEINSSSNALKFLSDQVVEKQSNISRMNDQLEQANSNFTKEKIIRDELLLQKNGEHVIQIVFDQPKIAENQQPTKNTSPWQAWQKLLLKN